MFDFAVSISVLTREISLPTFTQAFLFGSKPPLASADEEKASAANAISVCCFIRVPNYSLLFLIGVIPLEVAYLPSHLKPNIAGLFGSLGVVKHTL